jgi:uncharacterized membrane-anchored protein YitT (DUF2179 family)
MHLSQPPSKSIYSLFLSYFFMGLGAFLAAFAIEVFLIPNRLIDGGVVGIAMILGNIFGRSYLPFFLVLFNLPFIYLAYRSIGRAIVIHMLYSVGFFAGFLLLFQYTHELAFIGESLEVVVIGGAILGIGIGLIIRYGGCTDGTEILGIIINRRTGITVGQVVLVCNIFIFSAAGLVFQDWHPPILSLITYMVVIKVMDAVIVGLDETKSVLIISKKSKAIADSIIHELGLGLTVFYGRGGFSGEDQELLYVITERLQLSELKDLIHREDPVAFIAIENLHEVSYGKHGKGVPRGQTRIERLMSQIIKPISAE